MARRRTQPLTADSQAAKREMWRRLADNTRARIAALAREDGAEMARLELERREIHAELDTLSTTTPHHSLKGSTP